MNWKYLNFPRVVLSLALASVYATTITAPLFLTNTLNEEISFQIGILLFLAAVIELLVIVCHQDEIKIRTKKDDGVVSIIFSAVPGGVGAALLAALISQRLALIRWGFLWASWLLPIPPCSIAICSSPSDGKVAYNRQSHRLAIFFISPSLLVLPLSSYLSHLSSSPF